MAGFNQVQADTDITPFIVFTNTNATVNSGFNRTTAASNAAYAAWPGSSSWNSTFYAAVGGDCTNFVSWVWDVAGFDHNNTGNQSTGWWTRRC